MSEVYDSRADTLEHIGFVRTRLVQVVAELSARAEAHDRSKLSEPEKSVYDQFTPKLREMTYGSPEYKQALKDMGAGLRHHYAQNSHHPEHFERGISDMSLLDLIEMLADWSASIARGKDGNLQRSIEVNQGRFGYSNELRAILENTAEELGW